MKFPPIVQKYLRKHDQPKWIVNSASKSFFNNIIVVPAIKESNNIPLLIKSLENNNEKYFKDTLIILVVNNNINDSQEIKDDNKNLIRYLDDYNSQKNKKLNIRYIDACSKDKAFDDKFFGVGVTRKLGMDKALKLFDYSSQRKKILISLDADCTVSQNYLETIIKKYNCDNLDSAVIGYEHTLPEEKNHRAAIINYEIFLRYYVLGLRYSKSHYAFHSIGSTISCDYINYIKAGGMNKNKAGEDFYFLEKLAKVGKVDQLKEVLVFPSARVSHRVPFGTGPRINRFLQNVKDEYKLYNPKSFDILKYWHEIISDAEKLKYPDKIFILTKNFQVGLNKFLIDQDFFNRWNNVLKNSSSNEQLKKQINNWMDGFRTMKLIHFLRDFYFADINMFAAINVLLEKMEVKHNLEFNEEIPSLKVQEQYLLFLRKLG